MIWATAAGKFTLLLLQIFILTEAALKLVAHSDVFYN
jgi:hypothetical protein